MKEKIHLLFISMFLTCFVSAQGDLIISNFEDVSPVFDSWNTKGVDIAQNPSATGINTSDSVLRIFTSDEVTYEGVKTFPEAMDFSQLNVLSVKVYSEIAGIVLLKLEGTGVSPFEQRINYTQAGSWQELRFDMSTATSGVYTLLALFPDIDGTSDSVAWHFDDIQQTTNPHVTGENPITFETEGADYDWIVFDNTTADNDANAFSIVDNPDPSGINTSSKVGKYVMHVGAAVWAGVKTNSINPLITTEDNKWLTMDVYKADMDTVGLKFEPPSTNGVLVTVVPQTAGQWETLIFDFTEAVGDTFPTFVIFPDWTGLTRSEETIYFDNIAWHSSKPNVNRSKNIKVQPQYSVYPNPATSILNLKVNESEIEEVRIFDVAGCMVYCSKSDQLNTSINVDSFNRGFYILYITSKSGITENFKIVLK